VSGTIDTPGRSVGRANERETHAPFAEGDYFTEGRAMTTTDGRFRRRAPVLLLTAAALLVACEEGYSPTGQLLHPAATQLDIVSGNNQTAPAGSELPKPLVVMVRGPGGQPLANQVVNFRVVTGGGSVFGGA